MRPANCRSSYAGVKPEGRLNRELASDLRTLAGFGHCTIFREEYFPARRPPIVAQHTRLDSRQAENYLLGTIAYPNAEQHDGYFAQCCLTSTFSVEAIAPTSTDRKACRAFRRRIHLHYTLSNLIHVL
jgi:hypothetical protein